MHTDTRHWTGITAAILSLIGYAYVSNHGCEKYVYDASVNLIEETIDGVVTNMAYDQANGMIGHEPAMTESNPDACLLFQVELAIQQNPTSPL
jgi:hypothetical protein